MVYLLDKYKNVIASTFVRIVDWIYTEKSNVKKI
jgi:hypothetical protein